jgi:N-6 DNA Methylase.
MSSLNRNLRSLLEKTVLKARELAEKGALEALTTLGVDQPKPFDHLTSEQRRLRNQLRARGRQLGDALDKDSGRQELRHLIEVVAYEHWHRMLFARFLAENGLLLEPEHQVPVSLDDVEELARDAGVDVWELAGRYAERMLPAVFRADDPVLALPLARETRVALEKLVGELPREVFLADDSLGWTYQFWQAQRKEEVNKSGVKIGADELSPVTQLFTEDYMVEFLLHNTLGAWWVGKLGSLAAASEEEARAQAGLPEREGLRIEWTYLRFVQDEQTQRWMPAAGTFAGWPRQAKDVTVLDPSMGSGHFLVFALPLLARLRMEEENLGAAAAVAAVLRDNLYGLELDERCTQIAAFNLALAAWRLGGYQPLPPLHLACSGLAPNAPEKDWVALAGDSEKLQRGMARLYRLFQKAPVLGSLINPRAAEGDLLTATFHELQPVLEKALEREAEDDAVHELAVTARGLTKAAEILAGQFTLVVTNVPYLGRGKQDEVLKDYCERVHPEAKADLATAFVERCLAFCRPSVGNTALVTPQNWLFLGSYKHLRKTLLTEVTWDFVARLGPRAFSAIGGEVVNVALLSLTRNTASASHQLAGWDAAAPNTPEGKADVLRAGSFVHVDQARQIKNPDSVLSFERGSDLPLLSDFAESLVGIQSGDDPAFVSLFWEIPERNSNHWEFFQTTPNTDAEFEGYTSILRWEGGNGALHKSPGAYIKGLRAVGQKGVAMQRMRKIAPYCFGQERFHQNVAVIVPKDPAHLPAIWAFCSSPDYSRAVRAIDQALKVTNANLVKVPFDLEHWQKVAAEKYPNGLPKPYSSDPTQWLFNGHPKGSDQPLHVAVARLLGYKWPRQTGSSFPDCPALEPDGLEAHADADGIVCLSPVHGERAGADRLRALLSAALGDFDEHALITATGSRARDLETWLRDEFFEQHCALFHHRPFVWHLWDGRKDGFHALVNYHQLAAPNGAGRKLLETLTYTYLGDWIRKQQDAMKRNEPGAEDRLIAAQALQKELEAILAGEPPYDLFIRWKPLHQQPIGWEPDLNDGVRLNIRPFMLAKDVGRKGAGLLRSKPNIKWEKDRGKEPQRPKNDYPWFWGWDEKTQDFPGGADFDGNRWNACHYTPATKRAAREKNTSQGHA